ncbi:retrovirus-related pol polyprotein from transposon TNT 1-94 [Tanacetum coccineum]
MPNLKRHSDLQQQMKRHLLYGPGIQNEILYTTNNNLRISSICHRQLLSQNIGNQVVQNAVQNLGVQNVGNQNGQRARVMQVAWAEGNATRNNGNQIRCYNCRGLGHLATNCTDRPRRRDAAYLQTQLLIDQKEEA